MAGTSPRPRGGGWLPPATTGSETAVIYMRIDVRNLSINLTIMPALAEQLA